VALSVGDWFSVGGCVLGVAGLWIAFASLDSEWAYRWQIRRKAKVFPDTFKELAGQYRKADGIPDEAERLRVKDDLTLKLGYFALGRQLSRQALAAVPEEGYVVALAVVAKEKPERGDATLLAQAGAIYMPPHARYRVMEGISSLAQNGLVTHDALQELRELLNSYKKDMGPEHSGRVGGVLALLRDQVVAS
jgi:hypothetical protein